MPRLRHVRDANVLRAMAHPLRLRLIGMLRKEGSATASELARRLGESSGATSYHLRQLERFGFVEDDAERSSGRKRYWRACEEGMEWSIDTDDPGLIEANRTLGSELIAEYSRWLRRWYAETSDWDKRWRAAAEGLDQWFELTPEELRSLSDEVREVLARYENRRARRDGTERSVVLFHAFPERRDAT
jgi:DNA-binding transcriptional ArsR family regulator